MELRHYGHILKRRWWLIVIPVVIVMVVSAITYRPLPPAGYNVGVNFIVSQQPAPTAANPDENRYYNWLTSEYIVNGLTDWAAGGEFKAAVSTQLAGQGMDVPAHTFNVVADNVRSKLQLSVQHSEATTLARIMDAAIVVLMEQNAGALPQLGGETAVVIPVDQPVVNAIPGTIRSQLELPLRIALALFAGIGLALLIEYVHPTIHTRSEITALELPVLGEIPKK